MGLLKITSLLKSKTFVKDVPVLIRDATREANGDFIDGYNQLTYKANVQPGAATNAPNLLPKDEGEREQPRVAVYSNSPLNLGDFVWYEDDDGSNGEWYRVFRIEPWSRHGHYYVTAVRHIGPSGARSSSFVIT
ncbi:hypothetical protein SOI901_50 [Erwinia phage SOI901]